ncbi:hypothetical protein EC973_001840 [Apophysomyces ossiformis]|uniref:F-box domain-containing protein n=1 Tax=Apophysomyces ossiformis TaxID=679940 RepID=A0A8H7EN91_9FUNG|nr:hypothetical protein EC973_001840 [Apophysomyces ossiformis]
MSFSLLPTELIVIILKDIATCEERGLFDLLSAAMVCQTWYAAGVSLISPDELIYSVNHTNAQRVYPHRQRLAGLLEESKRLGLVFHRMIHMFRIDLLSFKENEKLSVRSPSPVLRLASSCPNIESLEIMYDAQFASMPTLVVDHLQSLANAIQCKNIRELVLTNRGSPSRCPCCIGRGWDHLLCDLIERLPLQRLTLHQVIPSQAVLKRLCRNIELDHLILYRSIIEMPSRPGRAIATSLTYIPRCLLRRIRTLEVYENLEHPSAQPPVFRYLYEVADRLESLECFVFEYLGSLTAETTSQCMQGLVLLAERQSGSLRKMVLRNIPGITQETLNLLLWHVDCVKVDSKLYNKHIVEVKS